MSDNITLLMRDEIEEYKRQIIAQRDARDKIKKFNEARMSQKKVKNIKRAMKRQEVRICKTFLEYACSKPLRMRLKFAFNIITRRYER